MALIQPELGHVAPAIGLVEEVGDRRVEQGVDLGRIEEVVLDVAERQDGQGQRRVGAPDGGVVRVVAVVAVEPERRSGTSRSTA